MQDLIRNLPAAVFEYAFYPTGINSFLFVSEGSAEVLGLTPQQLLDNPALLESIVVQDDLPYFKEVMSIQGNATNSASFRIQIDGGIRRLHAAFNDHHSAEGVLLRRGVIQKVADNDSALDDSGRYEVLFEKLPIGIVIHHDGKVLFANRYAHFLVGAYEPGQLIGLSAMHFVHPDYHPGIRERIKHVSAGQAVPMKEEKFVCLDGRVIDVETMAFPFVYQGKSAVQVIFRDITEKKRTEAQVRKNETLLAQLFQNVPMAVVMLDQNGKVSEVNRGFEEMFGFGKNELKGQNLNDFIVPENLISEGIDLNNLITSNRVVSMESIRRHKSGKLINVILCGVPVILDNQAIGIYGVYVDITHRKKVEQELKVRNAELDNFVYKVSHDLRAPLSSVLGLVNLSRLKGNTDSPLAYIELIGEKIMGLDSFIGDVLSHSKNLKLEVDITRVDLQKIIEQTFTDLSYLKGARETKRLVSIEGLDFYSDQWRVSEIFRNLISNAIKYRKPDADNSEVVIRIKVDHLCADISFADNGIGIREPNLKRIFEMFYRATDQGEGSGIGLYIVKNAVEKLGGQINVTSKPNEGTHFHLLLPNRIMNNHVSQRA